MNSAQILDRLVGFPTISRRSNLDLIGFVQDLLRECGVSCRLVEDETGTRANLHAVIGPKDRPGVILSGHTDVVAVDGQDWETDPFRPVCKDKRLYGRGAADMKGFVACAVHAARAAASRPLAAPLHLALSYDEEIGCVGVRGLIDAMADIPIRPAFCIVGEPTEMAIATGHKGKTALRAICTGRESHSARAPLTVNAVHLACDFIAEIRAEQDRSANPEPWDGGGDPPFTTLHVGRIAGGGALNIVPNLCEVDFEIRNSAETDPEPILGALRTAAKTIAAKARSLAPEADIRIETVNAYPGLSTPPDAEIVDFVKSLTGAKETIEVAYGTEGGLFSERLGVQTVVCGPGSMAQGHKPNEYIALEQLDRCDAMLSELLNRLEAGL